MQNVIDKNRLRSILDRLLIGAPETKKLIPSGSWGEVTNFALLTDDYFLLAFLNQEEMKRVQELQNKNLDPFPGLIKPAKIAGPVAFGLNRSQNGLFSGNKVENMYSFSLGKDCTLVIQNHIQLIYSKDFGIQKYTVSLAYLLSFGDEINALNFYDYLEDLIAFSLRK